METVIAIAMGLSLSACAGLRAFLPLFIVGAAHRAGWLPLQETFGWIGSTEALIVFGVATVAEILADKIPVLDHALDFIHTFARPVAGAILATSTLYTLSPTYALALGIMIGAPLAGGLHLTRATTRLASTATTGGLGNPVLSFFEDVAVLGGILLALVAPIVSVVVIGAGAIFAGRWLLGKRAKMCRKSL